MRLPQPKQGGRPRDHRADREISAPSTKTRWRLSGRLLSRSSVIERKPNRF
jgi:hypothetical protein